MKTKSDKTGGFYEELNKKQFKLINFIFKMKKTI